MEKASRIERAKDWSDADGSGKLSRKELEQSLAMIKRLAVECYSCDVMRCASILSLIGRACGDVLGSITDEAKDKKSSISS